MAEPTKDEEKTEAPAPVAPVIYLLKSVARGRTNRTARAVVPGRIPFVQKIAGGTILVRRARPARITEAALKANLKEIQKLVARCQLEVTTLDGRRVDLETLKAVSLAVSKPLPNPPLDSAKNDKNEGTGYDIPPTPEGTGVNAETPELLQQRLPEGTEPPPPADENPPAEIPPMDPLPAIFSETQPESAQQEAGGPSSVRKTSGKKRGER